MFTFKCEGQGQGQNRSNLVIVVYLPVQDKSQERCFLLIIPDSLEEARSTDFSEIHHIECKIDAAISTVSLPTRKVILKLKS
jgi:hypothetical protein